MAKLRVVSKFRGSRNGITVELFNVGEEVDSSHLGDDLSAVALREKWVEMAGQEQNPEKRETKSSQDLKEKAQPAAPKKARARKSSSAPKRRSAKKMPAEDDES